MGSNILSAVDDFSSSEMRERLNNDVTPKINTRVLFSTRLENMIYNALRKQVRTGLVEIETAGTKKSDAFPSSIQDVFQSLYSINPRRNDIDTLSYLSRT